MRTLFNGYVDFLLPPSQLSVKQPIDTVDFKSLIRLYLFLPYGNLTGHIEKNNESGERIGTTIVQGPMVLLDDRSNCDAHFVAHTYHMAGNFLLDTDHSLCLYIGSKTMPHYHGTAGD